MVETVFVITHEFGQGAKTVMEEAFAFTKEYEHGAKIVVVLKCVFTKEDEQHVKNAKTNVKQHTVPCSRQKNTKDIVLHVLFFYKNSTFMFIKWKILKGVENRCIRGPSTVKK